jgi:hypothetical protein
VDQEDGIEIVPGPSRFFDDTTLLSSIESQAARDSPAGDAHAANERLVWARRVAAYEGALANEYRRIRAGSLPNRPHPHHPVTVAGGTVDLVYDGTLDRQLRGLYVGHGWAGILAVRAGLKRAATTFPSRVLHPWDVVRDFAEYAIAELWARVRAALVELDKLATDDLAVQLNLSANLVNEAWTRLGVVASNTDEKGQRQRTPGPSPSWDSPTWTDKMFYRLKKPQPLRLIMESMPEAVALRRRLGEIKQSQEHLANELAEKVRDFGSVNPPGGQSTKISLDELAAEATQATAELEELLTRIHAVTPLAVLAVPFLQEPVTQIAVEQTIGEVLIQFRGEAERIVKGLPQGTSWVAQALPSWSPGRPVPTTYTDKRSPEIQVLDLAITGVERRTQFLSMLSERTFDRLVETGTVPKDSFAFAVWAHYKRELIIRLAVEHERAEFWKAVSGFLVKAATLLTILLLKAPAASVAARVTTVLNVGMLMFQCYSVVDQLAQLDQQLGQAVADVDRRSAKEISHIGELLASRRDFGEQLEKTIVTEIGLIVAAGAWPQFREMMHLRGFYFDLQTLLEP